MIAGLRLLCQTGEQVAQRKDLARPALALCRDPGHPVLVQHGSNTPGNLRRYPRMALHEVGQPRQDDGAYDAFGQRIAPGYRRSNRRHAGPLLALFRREFRPGELARTRCHTIDRDLRVMVENAFQPIPAVGHCRERPGAEFDPFAFPGHPPGGFEREIGTGVHEYCHDPIRDGPYGSPRHS